MSGDFAVHEGLDETGTARRGQAPRRPPVRAVPAAIEVSHLTKVFGGRAAVSDVSFSVAGGEVFGFLGPNGAGKTTTVRILGTLIAPTSGSAVVASIAVGQAGAAEIRQRIAVMPGSPGLYQRLTVTENLDYFARLYGLPRRQARITEALAAVGLADRAHDLAGRLSKGLRQRAALARSLLNEPAVMFLDEPTSGLAPVAAHEVHGLIAGLRDRAVTVFRHHPPAGGGRAAVRPGGDPEHQPEDHGVPGRPHRHDPRPQGFGAEHGAGKAGRVFAVPPAAGPGVRAFDHERLLGGRGTSSRAPSSRC